MEKAREFHKPIYICIIDFRKAYDSVNHNSLLIMSQLSYSIPTKFISIIRALHEHPVAAISCYGRLQMSLPSPVVSVRAVYWFPHSLISTLMWQYIWHCKMASRRAEV